MSAGDGEATAFTPADAADMPEIVALVRAAYAPYVPRIGREPAPMTADYGAAVDEGRVLLARRGARLLGILVTEVRADHLLVENVAVDPGAQGTGLGGRLLARAEQEACGCGLPELRLYTNARMTENLRFYARRGFREVARRTEDGFDRVYFARPVPPDRR